MLKSFLTKPKTNKELIYYSLVILLFVFFVIKAVEITVSIRFGIAPDETHHIEIIKIFALNSFLPEETAELYKYGLLNYSPYFYYLTMARIYNLNIPGFDPVFILRLVNVLFSTITVFFTLKLAGLVTKSRLVKLLTLVFITNLAMFTFLSGSVNYDNMVNMLAVMSIYFLLRFYKYSEKYSMLLFLLLTCIGLMTKITFIPLAFITGLILLVILYSRIPAKKDLAGLSFKTIKQLKLGEVLLTLAVIFSAAFVVNLYGRNVIEHKAIIPNCYQVTTYDNCQTNLAVRRDEEFLANKPANDPIDPYHYFFIWKGHIFETVFGIFGHESLIKTPKLLVPFELIIALSLIGFIRTFSLKNKPVLILTVISVFYILVLAYYQNYSTYRNTGIIHLALQGRYLFPVLAPIAVLSSYFIFKLFRNQYLRIFIFLVITGVFILGDYVYFKRKVPDTWYFDTNKAIEIRQTNRYFRHDFR